MFKISSEYIRSSRGAEFYFCKNMYNIDARGANIYEFYIYIFIVFFSLNK